MTFPFEPSWSAALVAGVIGAWGVAYLAFGLFFTIAWTADRASREYLLFGAASVSTGTNELRLCGTTADDILALF
jgi:hypothetical protein